MCNFILFCLQEPGAPRDLTDNPHDKNVAVLTLQWQPPLEPNGVIREYRIYYSTNANASTDKWQNLTADGEVMTKEISGLQPETTYYFKMQARTKKGWGPMSKTKKIDTLPGEWCRH